MALPVFLKGSLIGLLVTAPIGPVSMLCVSRTLTDGVARGLATGAGATTVQAGYALVLLLGLDQIKPWLGSNAPALSLGGALLMLVLAGCLLRQRGPRLAWMASGGSLVSAYLSALALNLINPMLLVVLLGSFTMVVGPTPPGGEDAALLLLGLCAGSGGWWLGLNAATSLLCGRMNSAMLRAANQATAGLLVAFSLLALVRALQG